MNSTRTIVDRRVAHIRDQTERFLRGELTEDEFRPLRLENGLYIQKHAPMLRIAIPYGLISSTQLRMLARISREYDRGYGHFTTRQNLQLNWPPLGRRPRQPRTSRHRADACDPDERQLCPQHDDRSARRSSEGRARRSPPMGRARSPMVAVHPEFAFLPRKFKIAITGATADRTALLVHDIGAQAVRNERGEIGFRVFVGGGQGRPR
jgi:sulfite reductase (NADPH) hemoprotein beta-component